MIIRICTEDKNHERVRELCAKTFDAFTIYHGMGAWKGKLEPSMTIDVAVLDHESVTAYRGKALRLAHAIKQMNAQEAVLVEEIASSNYLEV